MTYIIVSEKSWDKNLADKLRSEVGAQWVLINRKEDFTSTNLKRLNTSIIFIPHWSYIIPEDIYKTFETIIFHMTDLPFGRGGSPLQNLIARGIYTTKISALRATKEIDSGDIYLKKKLDLSGSAQEIFIRANSIIEDMIVEIIRNRPTPKPQCGEIVRFKRRKPEEGNLSSICAPRQIYDYIRMLDAEGYPPAFLETDYFKFEFRESFIDNDNIVHANVRIIKK